MDKETIEKIGGIIAQGLRDYETMTYWQDGVSSLKHKIVQFLDDGGYCKLPEGEMPSARNPYTTEYKYQCSMDAGMPQNLIVNDDCYRGFEDGKQTQKELCIKHYEGEQDGNYTTLE